VFQAFAARLAGLFLHAGRSRPAVSWPVAAASRPLRTALTAFRQCLGFAIGKHVCVKRFRCDNSLIFCNIRWLFHCEHDFFSFHAGTENPCVGGSIPPLGTMFGDASRSGRRAGLAGTPHPGNVLAGPLLSAREFSVFPVEAGIFADFPVSASIGARKG